MREEGEGEEDEEREKEVDPGRKGGGDGVVEAGRWEGWVEGGVRALVEVSEVEEILWVRHETYEALRPVAAVRHRE